MSQDLNRQLRFDLLQKALEMYQDLNSALNAAARMEHFVRHGVTEIEGQRTVTRKPPEGTLLPSADRAKRRPWLPDQDTHLREFWYHGVSVTEIARNLERTPASVYGRARLLGICRPGAASKSVENGSKKNRRKASVTKKSDRANGKKGAEQDEKQNGKMKIVASEISSRNSGFYADQSMSEVVNFLRSRDYSVVQTEDGDYKVDARHVVTAQELREKANRIHSQLGRSR
jgi:hypothetical protein